jgi:hypothetical protein
VAATVVQTITEARPGPRPAVVTPPGQSHWPATRRHGQPSFGSVVIAAMALPVMETGLLLALDQRGNAALGPQVSAPPPLDVFHDLRWVATYHNSWVMLAVELAVVLAARSAWIVWLVRPAVGHRTAMRVLLRPLAYYLIASVALLPFVALLFGAAVTHYSNLVIAGLAPAWALSLALHRGALAVAGCGSWAPTRRTMRWMAASLAWVSVSGAVVSRSPAPVGLLAAALAGWLNGCALQVLRSADEPRPSRRCTLRRTVVPWPWRSRSPPWC